MVLQRTQALYAGENSFWGCSITPLTNPILFFAVKAITSCLQPETEILELHQDYPHDAGSICLLEHHQDTQKYQLVQREMNQN